MLSYCLFCEYKNLSTLIPSHAGLTEMYNDFDRSVNLSKGNFSNCVNPYISAAVRDCLSLPKEDWLDRLERDIPELDILFCYADCISALYDTEKSSELPPDINEMLQYFQLEDSILTGITAQDGDVVLQFTNVLYYNPGGYNPPSSVILQIVLKDPRIITTPTVPSFTGFFGAELLQDGRYILAVYGDGGEAQVEFSRIEVQITDCT